MFWMQATPAHHGTALSRIDHQMPLCHDRVLQALSIYSPEGKLPPKTALPAGYPNTSWDCSALGHHPDRLNLLGIAFWPFDYCR
jgi:hypothetical protein